MNPERGHIPEHAINPRAPEEFDPKAFLAEERLRDQVRKASPEGKGTAAERIAALGRLGQEIGYSTADKRVRPTTEDVTTPYGGLAARLSHRKPSSAEIAARKRAAEQGWEGKDAGPNG
jgi:hypothetical protein